MVNRKSKNANFLTNGSPKKKMMDQITKKLEKSKQIKEKNPKRKPPITWDLTKDYFEKLENNRKIEKR